MTLNKINIFSLFLTLDACGTLGQHLIKIFAEHFTADKEQKTRDRKLDQYEYNLHSTIDDDLLKVLIQE